MSTVDDVRRIATALPGTTEGEAFGTRGFFVGPRLFARLHERPGVLVAMCDDLEARQELLERDPHVYFTTSHFDGHASVLVRLDRLDTDGLAEVLRDAWRSRAPREAQAAGRPLA